VYGMALTQFDGSSLERVVAINSDDYLCAYEKTEKNISEVNVFGGSAELLYKATDPFGGSNLYIQYAGESMPGDPRESRRAYINQRVIIYNTDGDKKNNVIVTKNISPTGRTLQQLKTFTGSEMYCFEWEGLGLAELWHTRKLNGYVADFQLADVDNDGEKELILALVTSFGSSYGDKSIIAIYKFSPQAERK